MRMSLEELQHRVREMLARVSTEDRQLLTIGEFDPTWTKEKLQNVYLQLFTWFEGRRQAEEQRLWQQTVLQTIELWVERSKPFGVEHLPLRQWFEQDGDEIKTAVRDLWSHVPTGVQSLCGILFKWTVRAVLQPVMDGLGRELSSPRVPDRASAAPSPPPIDSDDDARPCLDSDDDHL